MRSCSLHWVVLMVLEGAFAGLVRAGSIQETPVPQLAACLVQAKAGPSAARLCQLASILRRGLARLAPGSIPCRCSCQVWHWTSKQ